MPDIVRQPGARLTGQVDPRLAKRFYPGPLENLRRSYGAFHAFDKTHTVALTEAGLIPREAARAILEGLREMEAEGIEAVRDSMGGGRHSAAAPVTSMRSHGATTSECACPGCWRKSDGYGRASSTSPVVTC